MRARENSKVAFSDKGRGDEGKPEDGNGGISAEKAPGS